MRRDDPRGDGARHRDPADPSGPADAVGAVEQSTALFDRMTAHAWAVLLVLCGTVFLEDLDVAMMGVALSSMRDDLDLSTASLQWVVSAYVLGYGGFVLLGGRAADLLGRRRMFLLWLVVFIRGSAAEGRFWAHAIAKVLVRGLRGAPSVRSA